MRWFNHSAADMLHLDVMDGVFVPNLSFGFPVLRAVSQLSRKPLDVHLMVTSPDGYLDRIAQLPGVRYFNFHYEATSSPAELIANVRSMGLSTAITLKPETPVSVLVPLLPSLDLVLLMSVHPGFGGQSFIPGTLDKVRQLRSAIRQSGSKALIEVDGGVNAETGAQLSEARVDVLVAGSYVFRDADPMAAVKRLKAL